MTTLVDDPWVGAACREPGVSFDWFFLQPGESSRRAKAVCARCPLQRPCLLFAMEAESRLPECLRFGIFGATTPKQRAAMAAKGWGR